MVQLIKLDEVKMVEISLLLDPVVKHSKNFFTRLNHIYYDDPTDNDAIQLHDIMSKLSTLKFNLRVQSFSNVDDPYVFNVDMEHNRFKPAGPINQDNDEGSSYESSYAEEQANGYVDNSVTVSSVPPVDFVFSKVRGSHTTHNLRMKSIIDIERQLINEEKQNDGDTEDNLSSDDEDYQSDFSDEDDNSDEDSIITKSVASSNIRQYGPPTSEDYDVAKMITGVRVVKLQEFGTILAFKKRPNSEKLPVNDKAIPVRKDSYAKAVRYAKEIVSTSEYFHDSNTKTNPLYSLSADYTPESNFAISPSWARRKGYGQLYGETYLEQYKDDLLKMFNDGCTKSANKMNPGKMRENLMNMFPHRFSIPSELEIKKFIAAQSQKQKYNSKSKNTSETRGRKRNGTTEWKSSLIPLIEENMSAKPEEIYNMFLQAITVDGESLPPGLPMNEIEEIDKKKIKTIINQEKAKIKKRAQRDLI